MSNWTPAELVFLIQSYYYDQEITTPAQEQAAKRLEINGLGEIVKNSLNQKVCNLTEKGIFLVKYLCNTPQPKETRSLTIDESKRKPVQ